ncbi:hypothetical protein JTE90_016363 [Oedothorax gibbosus]|uniref:Partial AB-hydrolase lipase domain-containing protein n=1 Tax=Oedothorax gibbosus TaxID=931172 RepID=A0AAV6U823_9ARAC|nr:hypothetical protein JTE90_016363 [Oedothorax gibbosus]
MSAVAQLTISRNLIFTDDPDMYKNVSELISSKDYPVENHIVETQDGYVLQIQRIPYGRNGTREANKQVVFIMHGLLSSSNDWVINFPKQTLSFILADAGYDLWMGNGRGNVYSKKHKNYTTDMAEFWNFSFDEFAKYDIPAMIDFILKKTGQEELFFIGHSQGNTAGFALLSERQEYNKKIKLLIALGPVTTLIHTSGPLKYIAPLTHLGEVLSIIHYTVNCIRNVY